MGFWYLDIKPEIDHDYGYSDWSDAATYRPSNINYIIRSGLADPSTLACTIALGDSTLTRDQFGPDRSDFRLRHDGHTVIQGIISKVSLTGSAQQIQLAGEDYSGYLDRRPYPFDYSTFAKAAGGNVFTPNSYNGTTDSAIKAIIKAMNDETIDAVGSTIAAERTYSVVAHGTFADIPAYTIVPGDTTSIKAHIAALAQQDGSLGFDYYVDAGKVIHLYSGYYQTPPSNYGTILGSDIMDFDWGNDGPKATRQVGFGVGNAISAMKINTSAQKRFGITYDIQSYGDNYVNQEMVSDKTNTLGTTNSNPQHDATLTIRADQVLPLGGFNFYRERAGVVLTLDKSCFQAFRPYHTIPSGSVNYRATELNFAVQNDGTNVCTAALEQIYLVS